MRPSVPGLAELLEALSADLAEGLEVAQAERLLHPESGQLEALTPGQLPGPLRVPLGRRCRWRDRIRHRQHRVLRTEC